MSWSSATDNTLFEQMRILDPVPDRVGIDRLQTRFAAAFAALGRPGIATAWAGMIDTMPDGVPVIDHAAALLGLTIVTGLSGHGPGVGPGVGRVAADPVDGGNPGHDLARFSRFRDGTRLAPGPAL